MNRSFFAARPRFFLGMLGLVILTFPRTVLAQNEAPVFLPPARQIFGGAVEGMSLSSLTPKKPSLEATPPATLRWRNGESLAGSLLGGTDNAVTWQSPLFTRPLEIAWTALRRIDFSPTAASAQEPFSIVLRDGSHLLANLVSSDADSLVIRSARHGQAELKRSQVLRLQRLHGNGLLMAGPLGDVGWEAGEDRDEDSTRQRPSRTSPNTVPQFIAGPGGSLLLPYWDRSAFFKMPLPDRFAVDVRVRANDRPNFALTLGRLRLETWDSDLVLVAGDQFQFLRTLAPEEREISLRLCLNRKERKCAAYTMAGELLSEWSPPVSSGGRSGVLLQNKGRDLALEYLHLREWDGRAPVRRDPAQPRAELLDGRVVPGEMLSSSGAGVVMRTAEGETTIPLAEIDSLIFSADQPKTVAAENVLTFIDGTLLRGHLGGMERGRPTVRTSFSNAPISVAPGGLRQMIIDTQGAASGLDATLSELDTLIIGDTVLHGRMVGEGQAYPGWLPVGGLVSAQPAAPMRTEITRVMPQPTAPATDEALFYMAGGDILPAHLRTLDRTGLEVSSAFFGSTQLPAGQLDAILFTPAGNLGVQGFDHPAWRQIRGEPNAVVRTGKSLRMDAGAAMAHPSAMQGTEVSFTLPDGQPYSLRLRPFCAGTEAGQTSRLVIMRMGERVTTGLEGTDSQFDSQVQTRVPTGNLSVRLVLQERQVDLQLNGNTVQSFPTEASRHAGSGLILEPAGMWGNSPTAVTILDFSAPNVPGRTWLPEVNSEAKTHALTVPRFLRDDPPRQALLAGNGDVLRGEIEAATATHLQFRSGLETLRVPRDRVKAAIWLKKPNGAAPQVNPEDAVLRRLDQRINNRVGYGSAPLGVLISFLQQQAEGLEIRLPEIDEQRRAPMQFSGTIGSSLDQICALFDLAYHVEGDAIVLTTAQAKGKELQAKSYWLKPDAFPAGVEVQPLMVAKGFAFPPGASAQWDARAACLTVTHTPAELARLPQFLQENFGGIVGSPSYWVQMANGGRIGLDVERFDPDRIVGQHPLYGKCEIPFSEVYAVRSTTPPITPAMRSLSGWQLVSAPEPVLPQSGGQSSPLLGQEAKAFKLPLLAGGEFNLADTRGKVVVLDFWATWCGPCVHSIPQLVEAVTNFSPSQVQFVGVNQAEPAADVKAFMAAKGWNFAVALDAGQRIGQQFGVEAIPCTVIIAPDGKIAWVKTGSSPNSETEIAQAIDRLLQAKAAP